MEKEEKVESAIAETLGLNRSSARRKHLAGWLLVILILIGATTTAFGLKQMRKLDGAQYRTSEALRRGLLVTVTATGNLEPTNQVDVGSELSGIIRSVDVDYNDRVEVGQNLARLDTSKLEAQNLQAKAAVASSQARVLQAQATVTEARSNLARLRHVLELSGGKVPSRYDLDAAEAALQRAHADEASTRAAVSEAQAALKANETDLAKAVIRSPINGVVLRRNVEPGQTVAASLQAPVLFTLAENLTQMELRVDIDEADVGHVVEGQEATFTVDAYPGRTFQAWITQVRYGSETTDGVVTYKAVLKVDNSELLLRPGMTATADITVKKVEDVILIPNAALRFSPPAATRPASGRGLLGLLLPRRPGHQVEKRKGTRGRGNQQQVWILQQGQLVPVEVKTGATDGTLTEVTDGSVTPGMALVVDTVGGGK